MLTNFELRTTITCMLTPKPLNLQPTVFHRYFGFRRHCSTESTLLL